MKTNNLSKLMPGSYKFIKYRKVSTWYRISLYICLFSNLEVNKKIIKNANKNREDRMITGKRVITVSNSKAGSIPSLPATPQKFKKNGNVNRISKIMALGGYYLLYR